MRGGSSPDEYRRHVISFAIQSSGGGGGQTSGKRLAGSIVKKKDKNKKNVRKIKTNSFFWAVRWKCLRHEPKWKVSGTALDWAHVASFGAAPSSDWRLPLARARVFNWSLIGRGCCNTRPDSAGAEQSRADSVARIRVASSLERLIRFLKPQAKVRFYYNLLFLQIPCRSKGFLLSMTGLQCQWWYTLDDIPHLLSFRCLQRFSRL